MQPLDQIRAIAERVAASRGLDVWDIQSRREAVGHVIRVFIDRPGPAASPDESVSIEDCEQVNREISTILDVASNRTTSFWKRRMDGCTGCRCG